MRNYNFKNDIMNESDLQRAYNYPSYPKDSKTYSDGGFVNIDNGSQGGSRWVCFIVKITNHPTSIVSVVRQINFY